MSAAPSLVLPLGTAADLGLCPQRLQHLVHTLQSDVDRQRLPGAVVLVARHGQIALWQALGRLDPALAQPMPVDALFRIYSMTKPIVSVAALMLMEQGRLMLTDPITRYLPEFAPTVANASEPGAGPDPDNAEPATVYDLLRHTAGLTYEFMGSQAVHRQYAQARIGSRDRSNAEFVQALAALPLMHAPGRLWEYSRATDVLGRLIEVVSGVSLGEYLATHIFEPLGMRDTSFSVPPSAHARIAEPFARDPDGAPLMRIIDVRQACAFESGGGGLVSTAADYARFLQCLLNQGSLGGVRLLGRKTVELMTADHLEQIPVGSAASRDLLPVGHSFGLGFAVRLHTGMSPEPGSAGSYFWGGMAGTTFFVDPHEDLFAILMLQAPNQREYYRQLFRSLVYAAVTH